MIRGGALDGFSTDEKRALLASLGRRATADCSPDDAFAGALWSCLVEPGDRVGGALRAAFGPAGALAALALGDDELARRVARSGAGELTPDELAAARLRWSPRCTATRFRSAFRSARVLKVGLVVPGDAAWPVGVDDLGPHAPAAFWSRGDPELLVRSPAVALVGARAATAYGEQVTAELAHDLAQRGIAIDSGGAYGIDAMAHRATLAVDGATVAVLAGGVDRLYPAGNHDLLSRVAAQGLIVSELPCGTNPSRWRFLQRNRILAALSAATIVVEAGHRSGALNTAAHARALGRPVGAVPGPTTSPASAGCHRLIREAEASCVTGAGDVLELIEPSALVGLAAATDASPSPDEIRLLDALTLTRPRREAELAAISGLSELDVAAQLAVLEVAGAVAERESGWVRCRR